MLLIMTGRLDDEPGCCGAAHREGRHITAGGIGRSGSPLVTDFLCEGLGYDKYEELTTEYQVKGEFADYGIRIDKQLVAFIEVKRVAQKLGERHLRQVQAYACR